MLINNKKLILKILFFLEHSIYFFFLRVFKRKIYKINLITGYIIVFKVSLKYLFPILYFLRYHSLCLFKVLVDIGCVDFIGSKPRFTLVYNLLSFKFHSRFFIKVNVSNISILLSCSSIFNAAK
jgi:NADH:ubiquinone oxidoreductase subunit C